MEKLEPKIRFSSFKDNWNTFKLGEISAKIGSGKTPSGGDKVYTVDAIPFIRSQNVNEGKLTLDGVCISEKIHKEMKGSTVVSKDVLLNITGASIGRSCVVPDEFVEGNVNQHVSIIRLKKANPQVIHYILSSKIGQKLIYETQTGSGREGLNFDSIKKFKFNLPTLPEQQKIATFLTTVDEKINLLKTQKSELERYKKGVMQKIFPSASSGASPELRFKDSEGKEFAEWEKSKINKLVRIYDGTHQTPNYVESGIPFYSVEHVTANQFEETKFISREVFDLENKRVKLETGDILMTRIGSVGKAKLIDWDVEASFYVSLAMFKKSDKISNQYLVHFIHSVFFQRELWKRTIHVAFPQKINLGDLGECQVKYPSILEQTKIANFLSALDEKIALNGEQITKMEVWKKGLLQQMFV